MQFLLLLFFCIYIPLWFYSNTFLFYWWRLVLGIYIPLWFYSNLSVLLDVNSSSGFTFHYGSILIQYAGLTLLFVRIYIPLWFYSNESIKKIFEERKIYIPLWFYSNVIPCFSKWLSVFIYIPLWFYSNQNLFLEIASLHEIYIPLWFYSNILYKIRDIGLLNLHSTMVLF